ncbi:NAD(P)/FAD-dependent oxidoreductase [Natrinema limicola]|uniref:FAD-dependent pyridine nucleotide-disulfide oxidoreductase n=1 Tax=Natrinema limicola JCM 13563 TaxID=1230457 RepID=M0C466_9EURY|nr:NAD(P)/FAD-dependent oxidoreductase [Natrinema limicola]ELZ17112.1 FAD-dependent pyridine nucleotide-disulfide oxidoreductase [Natrinema limicola JCM 13563]
MSEESPSTEYEVIVVGGGPAGMTAALYSTRLGHRTAVVSRGGGRAAMMQEVHNLLGVREETSGAEFLGIGREQLEAYGCDLHQDMVTSCSREEREREERLIRLSGNNNDYEAEIVILATGFNDVRPEPPLPRTGRGLHYCLHCDAHMFVDKPAYVMGHSESAAHVAGIMLNFTDEVDLLTRGDDPEWSDETAAMLERHPIDIVHEDITGVQNGNDGWLKALEFEDGVVREYKGGFAMYGAEYNNGLARELGCEINDDGTIEVGDHGQTSVEGVYAVGDCTPGHNQLPIGMGQGAKAGIDVHFQLRAFPRDPDILDEQGPVRSEEVPGIPDELLEQAVDFHTYE